MQPWGPNELRHCRRELARAPHEPWDLVVVGGGITGAGIARDAALRGLCVLLLEAQDIAFGTSSRSTRLIHGGVRYLERGEFGLVSEALRERTLLRRLAPHLVRPAKFLFPSYRGDRLSPLLLRLGLSLYDALNRYRDPAHEYLDAEAASAHEPQLTSEGLRGAVLYEDAVTDDARLTLAVMQDAVTAGATVSTYTPVEAIERLGDDYQVRVRGEARIPTRACVVATGPWTSETLLGEPGRNLLTLSKGVHLVVRADDIPVRQPVVIQVPGEQRILFVVPWGTRTYLGTTDTPYTGDPGHSGVTPEDEHEVLAAVRRVLPNTPTDPARIVGAWSGVRPLVRGENSSDTVELSRSHRVVRRSDGVLGIVGGKLTTYRAMAEEVVDDVVEQLLRAWPQQRPRPSACTTASRPLVAGDALSAGELADPLIADLMLRHGPRARMLAGEARRDPRLAERVVDDLPYRWVEIDHAIRHEGCMHLDDVLRRRVPLAITDPLHGGGVAVVVARMLVEAHGGSESDVREELERYVESVTRETRRRPHFPDTITAYRPTTRLLG